jgi:hypothetical protein
VKILVNISNKFQYSFSSNHRKYFAVFVGVFAIALSFAIYTNHTWEDYYITYRPSKNLATGHGLVFVPGERVHTFTSPFNVLVPAIFSMITGNASDDLVLWLYRLVCCCGLSAAAVFFFRIARHSSFMPLPLTVLLGLFATDGKIVDFSINGQETGAMMFFLALMLDALLVPSRLTTAKLSLSWAGLMWTRPDGFIYFGSIALGFLLFNAADSSIAKSRFDLLKLFLKAGVISAVLYLPWLLWAWSYYGSPVPHTVLAKNLLRRSGHHLGELIANFLMFPFHTLAWQTSLNTSFIPIYARTGGWPYVIFVYGKYLAWICAFYWCFPLGWPKIRAGSFAFMCGHFYLTHIAAYPAPWYIPNCEILGIFVFAHIVQQSLKFAVVLKDKVLDENNFKKLTLFIRVLAEVVLVVNLVLTLCMGYQLRIQQRIIEDGNRKQIGLWLRQHAASSNETVFLEPLGYIGYFSQLRIYDFPGLASPEVVAARKKLGTEEWAQLIPELKPDWLVLRPGEANSIHQKNQHLLTQTYSLVKTFDVSQQLESYHWIPGRDYLLGDQTFMIFKRNKS